MNFVNWHTVGGMEGCKDGVHIICHIISMGKVYVYLRVLMRKESLVIS